MKKYKQCKLAKADSVVITWLEEDKAIKGSFTTAKFTHGLEEGWLIEDVYDGTLTEKELKDLTERITNKINNAKPI